MTSGIRVSVTAFRSPNTIHEVEEEVEDLVQNEAEPVIEETQQQESELPESERLLFTPQELTERTEYNYVVERREVLF